jgi:hypothetical protein
MSMAIASDDTLTKSARALGRKGGRVRWQDSTETEKREFSRMMLSKRWPDAFAKQQELEAEREASHKRNRRGQQ